MTNTIVHKYKTFKTTKSTKKPTSDEVFNTQYLKFATTPSQDLTQPKSYTSFIAELIIAFNSLSTTSAAPTSSPTLHTFFQGADHEAHVDEQQKKKVVKALRLADPAKVNEVISILKAMPDPTLNLVGVTKAKTSKTAAVRRQLSDGGNIVDKKSAKQARQEQLAKELEEWDTIDKKYWGTQKSNDQKTGVIDPESCKGIMSPSWWFSTTEPPSPTPTSIVPPKKSALTKASSTLTLFGSSWLMNPETNSPSPNIRADSTKKPLSTGEQIALAAASLLAIAAISKPKDLKTQTPAADNTTRTSSGLRRQASMPAIRSAPLKTLLPTARAFTTTDATKKAPSKTVVPLMSETPSSFIGTISTITRQFLIHSGPPPTHMISACTFWWGYEIYVPHKSMATIERVTNTSQVFFNILSTAISGVPGLAALVPIAKIISAWVGYQWAVIKAEDLGKGVIISATWVLPVALASRSWDQPGAEDKPLPSLLPPPLRRKSLKAKLGLAGV
ncbi:hypothetical protein BGX27_010152 [Mortierella sp. AM989]|nr:hypothetical protein BGX27_010152 [Mortierella sp. AM989]